MAIGSYSFDDRKKPHFLLNWEGGTFIDVLLLPGICDGLTFRTGMKNTIKIEE